MKGKNILANKKFLYVTEFFSGMSVMAVELGASRLLAPYFSSSQIVWTIIIGTIMIAMALGNVFGGKWADRDPDPNRLYKRILISAVWIAAIPALGKYLILLISGMLVVTVSTHLLIWAALLCCLIIFVYPLFLLGTVTPSLIKYTINDLKQSGSVAGKLGAFNTIGSIIGTFLPTFVTIPAVGTAWTFLIFAGILMALAITYFTSVGRGARAAAPLAMLAVFAITGTRAGVAFWEGSLAYEGESVYNYLQVRETEREIILSTNVLFGVQSVKEKKPGLTGMYYDYALAAPVMACNDASGAAPKVLILGNGTGTYASQIYEYFAGADVSGVEIDGKIIDLSYEYFDAPQRMETVEFDGRAYLAASDDKYDVIMVDAYRDITIPFQMSSVEFFELVKQHLNDEGVMVVNMNMGSGSLPAGEEGDINTYLADTIGSVFDAVVTCEVPGTTNRELFAGSGDLREKLDRGIDAIGDGDLRRLILALREGLDVYEPGSRVMTDDKAPVEMLGMRQLDLLIRDELAYYKDLIISGDFLKEYL